MNSRMFCALFLLLLLPFAQPARCDHFTFRGEGSGAQERGIISAHGMDLFEITTSAGGAAPSMRAEIVAGRLEKLANRPDFSPWALTVGFRNGEIIIQHQDRVTTVIATVDRRLAQRYPGAGGSVERLAQWWLALLRDHYALANGRKPVSTIGTMAGQVFAKLYEEMGSPTGPMPPKEIERSIAALSEDDRQVLAAASATIPSSFHPDGESAPNSRQGKPRSDAEITPSHGSPERSAGSIAKPPAGMPKIAGAPPKRNRDSLVAAKQHASPPDGDPAQPDTAETFVKVGDYKVALAVDPQTIPIGKKTELRLKLANGAGKEETPGSALMRAWVTKTGDKPGAPIVGVFDAGSGEYLLDATFDTPGDYRLTVGVITESQDTFKAMFDFPVRPAVKRAEPVDSDAVTEVGRGNSRRSGPYQLSITVDPAGPAAGKTTSVQIQIVKAPAAGGKGVSMVDAKVAAWFVEDGQQIMEDPPIKGRALEVPGLYGWRIRFSDSGRYRMVVEVVPAAGEKFRVEFPINVL